MKHTCPYCDVGDLCEVEYTGDIKSGRVVVSVPGLLKLVCQECGEESIPLELYDRNFALIKEATENLQGAVSRGLLRRLREIWGVSQRDASRLFGAGLSSFGKWESGQAKMSTPAALLVQCALNVPGVVPYLARLAGVETAPVKCVGEKLGGDPEWREAISPPENDRLVLIESANFVRRKLPPSWSANSDTWGKLETGSDFRLAA